MGLEKRGGKYYFYRKERDGTKVKSVYMAGGKLAKIMAEIEEDLKYSRSLEKEAQRAKREEIEAEHRAIDEQIDQTISFIENLTRAALLVTGHHTHKGQWRKSRKKDVDAVKAKQGDTAAVQGTDR